MRLKSFTLKNFRGYKEPVTINFDALTAFVGKNDSGKSTILEALDLFFYDGKGTIKFDEDDINVDAKAENKDAYVELTACFDSLPNKIIIDSTNETNLASEFLVDKEGLLKIRKRFGTGSPKTFAVALHPTNKKCNNLLSKKSNDLKKIIKDLGIEDNVDLTRNADMRSAIWKYYSDDLQLAETEIELAKEDAKKLWAQISTYLPIYSLFQSDRRNSDSDTEIQDPLKHAVNEIIKSNKVQQELDVVAKQVLDTLEDVANRTLAKLNEMDPELAGTLKPVIPEVNQLKWTDVFKNVSIAGDDGIPINKRGSGVRRLILLNFFRAEADRKLKEQKQNNSTASIIYAVEEPETSQHFSNQEKLIAAFKDLAKVKNVQVILTTHSSTVVKNLSFEQLRLIVKDQTQNASVHLVKPNCLPYPSLNEVSYVVFGAAGVEYHDELYGILKATKLFGDFKQLQNGHFRKYISLGKDGSHKEIEISLTEYIRHEIHHPENKLNKKFTEDELNESIDLMRKYIVKNIDMIKYATED